MTNHPLCAVDGRPVHTDGNLCSACWADLDHDLTELVESLIYDLDRTLAGLGKTGGSPIGIVIRTAARGIGFDERAGDLLRQLHNTLGGWVRVLAEDNALPLDVRNHPLDLAAWLKLHEREIRRHEAVAELWQEIHDLTGQARRITDRRPDKRYLGVCSALLDPLDVVAVVPPGFPPRPIYCAADLYAIEDRTTVTCRACEAVHDVAVRRRILLDAVDDQLGTAAEISQALAAYADQDLKVERVRKWAERGKIAQYPPRKGERWPRYCVGDVRDILDPDRTVKAG